MNDPAVANYAARPDFDEIRQMLAAGDREGGDWCDYWQDMRNLRWGALDRHLLEVVGDAMGWGPHRELLELGGGRGWHSRSLYLTGRCGSMCVADRSPEARMLARRAGCETTGEPGQEADVVWSSGLIEHFSGHARQGIVDDHFRLAREQVVIVVPAANLQRRLSPPRPETPWAKLYTEEELWDRMVEAALNVWGTEADLTLQSFAPLFGVRHIPDALYPTLSRLVRPFLNGGLIIGTARKAGE